jgi:hypothetical protein
MSSSFGVATVYIRKLHVATQTQSERKSAINIMFPKQVTKTHVSDDAKRLAATITVTSFAQ